MTEVIAVRRFRWAKGPPSELTVSIGKPAQASDGNGEYYCPIKTTGFSNDDFVQPIFGVDAFQALQLALRYVEYRIADIDKKSGGQLRWGIGDGESIPKEWAQELRGSDS